MKRGFVKFGINMDIGFETFQTFVKVLDLVSKKIGIGKVLDSVSEKNGIEKSFAFGIEKIGIGEKFQIWFRSDFVFLH